MFFLFFFFLFSGASYNVGGGASPARDYGSQLLASRRSANGSDSLSIHDFGSHYRRSPVGSQARASSLEPRTRPRNDEVVDRVLHRLAQRLADSKLKVSIWELWCLCG